MPCKIIWTSSVQKEALVERECWIVRKMICINWFLILYYFNSVREYASVLTDSISLAEIRETIDVIWRLCFHHTEIRRIKSRDSISVFSKLITIIKRDFYPCRINSQGINITTKTRTMSLKLASCLTVWMFQQNLSMLKMLPICNLFSVKIL